MNLEYEREKLLLFAEFFNKDGADLSLSELKALSEVVSESKTNEELKRTLATIEKMETLDEKKLFIENYIAEKKTNLGIPSENTNENKGKRLVFKSVFQRNNRKAGFADILLLSLATGFTGGFVTTIMLYILNTH